MGFDVVEKPDYGEHNPEKSRKAPGDFMICSDTPGNDHPRAKENSGFKCGEIIRALPVGAYLEPPVLKQQSVNTEKFILVHCVFSSGSGL
jgi:hypothetical protein